MKQIVDAIPKQISILFLLCIAALPAFADDYGSATVKRVTSIYDGDTFRVDIEGWPAVVGERVPVRILGIDTPELRGSSDCEKLLARAAKQFTVAKLREADEIRLEHIDRGKYFRLLADVMVDGASLGQALIEAGHARPYDGGAKAKEWCE
ncbi:endonuclease YncB(thermonuclease family) [Modicisalibacter xianhensis]|uniref:Endonuclease YncB(Thermonuclease family) n=1 Tax=Modicisalibacter xianhensis TaxID=442341 RepID=A0A4R8FZI8_9GAMM|nr:thermonuclease family protein [Halomonas xianhensis]TDX29082.1 endonuclease YncB(thermonuclease family) [Halomonas xianhensis]